MEDYDLFEKARSEIGDKEYFSRFQYIFGKKCLNYVDTIVIIHRSGAVCGSWYEDDKLLFKI